MHHNKNQKWPPRLDKLVSKLKGLNVEEQNDVSSMLTLDALRFFLQLRYGPNPEYYDNITTRKTLVKELVYSRYD